MKKIIIALVFAAFMFQTASIYAEGNGAPAAQSDQARSVEKQRIQLILKIAKEKRLVIYFGGEMDDCLRKLKASKTDADKKRYQQAYEVNAAFQQDSYDLIDIFQKRLDALEAQQ